MARKKRYATHVTGANGERVFISASNKEDFERKVMEAKVAASAGVELANSITFREFAQIWLRCYKQPPKTKKQSYDQTKRRVENIMVPWFADQEIRRVKPLHIHAFVNSLTCGPTTQVKLVRDLRSIFAAAVENNIIMKSPVPDTIVTAEHHTEEKEPLTNEEALHLLDIVRDTPAYLFCLIALSTGMRRGEILGLKWKSVDLDAATIHVSDNRTFSAVDRSVIEEPFPKTNAGRRDLPIPAQLLWELRAAKQGSTSQYVIHNAERAGLSYSEFYKMWYHVERGLRKEPDLASRVTPHILRHTYITQLFEAGLDIKQVQHLAGHSSPEVTLKIYTHYREKARKEETANQVIKAMDFLSAM